MKTINLVYPEKSDIKYKISKFPDGQQQITLSLKDLLFAWTKDIEIQIKSRLNDFKDLELIICTVASLRGLGVKEIHLYVPYIVGARSDRKFEEGSNNYLKDIICPLINNLNLGSVTCIDPHSDCLEMGTKNFNKYTNEDLVKWVLNNPPFSAKKLDDLILISPDAGASKKIYKIAEQIGYKGDIITCSKDRDVHGKLTKVNVPLNNLTGKDIIIIDDICDGGATFINIAKEIREHYTGGEGKIYLIVTHGIFSKGFGELSQYFDGIYTTNSYRDLPKDIEKFVKQLNIF